MKWPEAHEAIRQKMLSQPRGYQVELARKLGKTAGFISQIAIGRRPIPHDALDTILESLGLVYEIELREVTKCLRPP